VKGDLAGNKTEVNRAPQWFNIFETNWHRLQEKDVRAWEWQIRNVIPDATDKDMLQAVVYISRQPSENKEHPKTPKPQNIINTINMFRAQEAARLDRQSSGYECSVNHFQELVPLAEEDRWQEVNQYLFDNCKNDEVNASLRLQLKNRYPTTYRIEWSEHHCLIYEGLRNRRCQYWPKGIVPPRELGKLDGTLFVEKETKAHTTPISGGAVEIGIDDPF
jgi:hypothetical protein